ncbi:MAG: four helix bundle protein [Acidobacteria bacterium]|nr:MAG: four helix bundle protein [Acidobacteriota bacterium]
MDRDLKDRTREFALRVMRLCSSIPASRTNDGVARQLLRAGTSPGAHFREALRARSKAEYVSKMNGGLMELEETLYWLEIVEEAGLVPLTKLEALKTETDELIAIFISLINKWRPKSR